MTQPTIDLGTYAEAARVLAAALDDLGARMYRDLHPEFNPDGPTPQQLDDFVAYAEQQLETLDHPAVRAVCGDLSPDAAS